MEVSKHHPIQIGGVQLVCFPSTPPPPSPLPPSSFPLPPRNYKHGGTLSGSRKKEEKEQKEEDKTRTRTQKPPAPPAQTSGSHQLPSAQLAQLEALAAPAPKYKARPRVAGPWNGTEAVPWSCGEGRGVLCCCGAGGEKGGGRLSCCVFFIGGGPWAVFVVVFLWDEQGCMFQHAKGGWRAAQRRRFWPRERAIQNPVRVRPSPRMWSPCCGA